VIQEQVVLTERRGAALLVTLHRPERLNAWVPAMETAYLAALADADADVRAVVVTGAGRGFCAGADLGALAELDLSSRSSLPERRWDAFRTGRRVCCPGSWGVAALDLLLAHGRGRREGAGAAPPGPRCRGTEAAASGAADAPPHLAAAPAVDDPSEEFP
jgi:hypothetical protein